MAIRIVTDSTCDLPASVVADHGITVVPLYINMGDQSYLDGVEITREEFYERLPNYNPPPTTSAPGTGTFVKAYEDLATQGADHILSIHISAKLSNVVNVARIAAEATEAVPITVIDSGQLTIGTGMLALDAIKAAEEGHTVTEIVQMIEAKRPRMHTVAALDTLEFLKRSGRLSQFQAMMGTILKIKPILIMANDVVGMERVRTRQRAVDWLIDYLEKILPVEQLVLVHTHAPEAIAEFYERVRPYLPTDKKPLDVDVTPVLGAHIGPGVVGFTCVAAALP
ncbi:MAG: DegV family protein [Anaerolineae bacterium]|jgi:DegV family protein with EDD domain|nr:DegV family protein [Anaerolineae bacterium]